MNKEKVMECSLECATRYPIVLVHGVGFRQRNFPGYWGRIPKQLIHRGAQIFYTCHDAWGTLEGNGAIIRENIMEILRDTGAEKVNIIAHSNGIWRRMWHPSQQFAPVITDRKQ